MACYTSYSILIEAVVCGRDSTEVVVAEGSGDGISGIGRESGFKKEGVYCAS